MFTHTIIVYIVTNIITIVLVSILKPVSVSILILGAMIAQFMIIIFFPILFAPVFNRIILITFVLYYCTVIILGATAGIIYSLAYSAASNYTLITISYSSSGVGFCVLFTTVIRIAIKAICEKDSQSVGFSIGYLYIMEAFYFVLIAYFIKVIQTDSGLEMIPDDEESSFHLYDAYVTFLGNWIYGVSGFICTFVTYSLLPFYLDRLNHLNFGIEKEFLFSLIYIIFALFEFIGRLMSMAFIWPKEKYSWLVILARTIIAPLVMLYGRGITELRETWWSIAWFLILALTQGYFNTICFIHGVHTQKVERKNRKISAFLMMVPINLGIVVSLCINWKIPSNC